MNPDYCFTGGLIVSPPGKLATQPAAIWTFHTAAERDAAARQLRAQGDRVRCHVRSISVEGHAIVLYIATIRPKVETGP